MSQQQGASEVKEDGVTATYTAGGFYIPYAAAAILVPVMGSILWFTIQDHNSIERLNDKVEDMKGRIADATVVAKLIDHDVNNQDRFKSEEDRIRSLETFAGSSTQDRAALHFELNSLREYLRYLGKNPPDAPTRMPPDAPVGHP